MLQSFETYHPIDQTNPTYVANPQSVFKWLRDNAPVTWHPDYNGWVIVKASDYDLAKNENLFGKPGLRTALQKINKASINLDDFDTSLEYFKHFLQINTNDDRHKALHKLLMPFFTKRSLLTKFSEPIIDEAIDILLNFLKNQAKNQLEINWEEEFCVPFTGIIANRTLGLSTADCIRYYHLSIVILDIFTAIPNKAALDEKSDAILKLVDTFTDIIKKKDLEDGDLLSDLIKLRLNGDFISDRELVATLIMLSANLYLTIVGILSNILNTFSRHPDSIKQIKTNYSLLPNAIKEAIRYDGLGLFVSRIAMKEIEIRGKTIKANDQVFFFNSSANWDEEVFIKPYIFDIHRDLKRNYSFGIPGSKYSCIAVNFTELICNKVFLNLFREFAQIDTKLDLTVPVSYIFKSGKRQIIKLRV